MPRDIFSMSQKELDEHSKVLHEKIKKENASFGLPTTGYSDFYKCVVDTYADGRIEKVNLNKTRSNISKQKLYSGY